MQSALYPSMYRVLQGIDPGLPSEGTTLAEGIAVKEPGQLTRRIVAELVGAVRLVTERQLEAAIELLIERQKLVVEGAGAAGLAALMAEPERFRGRRVGIVLTGGNIDARLLASLLMRGLVRGGRLVRLAGRAARSAGSAVARRWHHRRSRRQHRRGASSAAIP